MPNNICLQVGVKLIIFDLNTQKILTIKRSMKDNMDFKEEYDIPGGRLKLGEEPLDGLKRELKEELNYDLAEKPQILDASNIVNDKYRHIIRITYGLITDINSEKLKLSDEHSKIVFLPFKENNGFHPLLNKAIVDFENIKGISNESS
jgi:ADP-ribose pyrophosphatase YjhB (NUDIX family)